MSCPGKRGKQRKEERAKEEGESGRGKRKERKEEGGASCGAANPALTPGARTLQQGRAAPCCSLPPHASEIRQAGGRTVPRRQSRPFPLLKYLCARKAAASRADSQALLFRRTFSSGLCHLWFCGLTKLDFSFLKSIPAPPPSVFPLTASQK